MGLAKSSEVASRFSAYVEGLASVIGHAERGKPLRDYCTGLMMPCDRKSVEPMAAMTAPERTAAQYQPLLHFVGQGDSRGVAQKGAAGCVIASQSRQLNFSRTVSITLNRRGISPGVEVTLSWSFDSRAEPQQGHCIGTGRTTRSR